jgi:hypothetical protein
MHNSRRLGTLLCGSRGPNGPRISKRNLLGRIQEVRRNTIGDWLPHCKFQNTSRRRSVVLGSVAYLLEFIYLHIVDLTRISGSSFQLDCLQFLACLYGLSAEKSFLTNAFAVIHLHSAWELHENLCYLIKYR